MRTLALRKNCDAVHNKRLPFNIWSLCAFSHVNWPHQHDPRRSAIYALNDVDVKAPPEMVWKLLIDAHNWSKFYPHAQDLKIVTGERVLGLRAKYSLKTADIPLVNTVQEFVPGERISWDSFLAEGHEDSSAYHGWIITPTDGGCHLLTEETQRGPFFVEELARKHPGTLYQFHQDWVETVARYVSQFPRENHHLKVLRAFQDGPYVFTQEEGLILGQSVFFDIFRFEDGLIVEHWVFSTEAAPPNESGHTQTDGPTEAKHDQDTEKNKSIMRDYYETVHISGDHSKIPQYFSGDHCIRHETGVSDGVAALIRALESLTQHRSIDEITLA